MAKHKCLSVSQPVHANEYQILVWFANANANIEVRVGRGNISDARIWRRHIWRKLGDFAWQVANIAPG